MNDPHSTPNQHPLKIAIVHYACAPTVGGVESIMTTHAQLLVGAGHKPFLVAGRGNPQSVGLEGVIIPELDSRHPDIVRVQKALRDEEPGAVDEFRVWVARIQDLLLEALEGTDVCIAHNAMTLHKNLPLTVALAHLAEHQLGARRWIAWCHDLAWNNPLYAGELQPRWPWTPLKYPLPNITYVAISEQRREEMAHLFRVPLADITLVPNGIDPATFIPASPEMRKITAQISWEERDWVFLAPVRITRRKNLELGIEIIAAMRDLGIRPLLVVTGPPGPHNVRSHEYLDELTQRRKELGVEGEVIFLAVEGDEGRGLDVSDELMVELYWWADALLMPSSQEGFGLPLLEAGLTRLPIFCSNIPVLREVGGRSAHYFDPQDAPAEIAEQIVDILRKPGVAAHRRKVIATYGWHALFESRIVPLLHGDA